MRDGNKYTYLFKERDMEAGGVRSNFETKKIEGAIAFFRGTNRINFIPVLALPQIHRQLS